MADRFVNDDGDNSDGLDWGGAYTSIGALITAEASFLTTSGNRVIFGSDHTANHGAALTIVGPSSGLPVIFISATPGVGASTTVDYAVATADQIDTSGGARAVTFDGAFALYGIQVKSGDHINLAPDANETWFDTDCTFKPASNRGVNQSSTSGNGLYSVNCTIDLTADAGGTLNAAPLGIGAGSRVHNASIINPNGRTRVMETVGSGGIEISGLDVSGFASGIALMNPSAIASMNLSISNVRTPATFAPFTTAAIPPGGRYTFTNCGPADAPTYIALGEYAGNLVSAETDGSLDALIYRTGGATVEGYKTAWLITTTATCSEEIAFRTPWIYGVLDSTGAKTFSVYITHDADSTYAADFDNSQVWLELEFLGTADEADFAFASDRRATITATPTTSPNSVSRDDTGSTWNGTGPSFTYKQMLQVPATVNETGQYRLRVAVGAPSIGTGHYFYADPKVVVT